LRASPNTGRPPGTGSRRWSAARLRRASAETRTPRERCRAQAGDGSDPGHDWGFGWLGARRFKAGLCTASGRRHHSGGNPAHAHQASQQVCQAGGAMRTTLDLPDHLMRQVKQRALQQGRPIKALMADSIRQGLHGPAALPLTTNSGVLEVDEEGLPLFRPDPQLKRHSIDLATSIAAGAGRLDSGGPTACRPACLIAMCGWPQPLPSIRPMLSPAGCAGDHSCL